MTTIQIAGGAVVVDEADLDLVAPYRWHVHANGYVSARPRRAGVRSRIYLHRLILDPGPGLTVDHINRDKLDNRRANLRPATHTQQKANQPLRPDNTTGYRGVSRHAGGGWRAQITIGRRQIYLGRFTDPHAAAREYDRAALSVWGEFAVLNRPDAS